MKSVLRLITACACVSAWADDAPIGVFDSGLGGLTVLERLLDVDQIDNATGLYGPDGVPDLARERFVYLGDQANMPYGDYAAEGKSDYLRELILKDAKFLLSTNYYRTAEERVPSGLKPRAKIIVIACNTATAWGLDDVRKYLATIGDGTKVVGVIEAGVRASLDQIGARPDSSPFAVGVMATPGTIASGAYERTIRAGLKARGVKANVRVISQGCAGLADAIECGSPAADAIAKCSWSVDLHYDKTETTGVDYLTYCVQPHFGRTYVPFRSIYSRNIPNLLMAGRCFSTTHVGLGSPRVINTLSQMGVAAGYAAAICRREGIRPREVFARGLVREIQRKMGGDWPGNPDPAHATWRIVDDESEGVTFGKGWRLGWNCNGEQVGHVSHRCGALSTAEDAVYPLPVAAAGRYRIHVKTPFAPWPREKMSGRAAYRVETAEGDRTVLLDHYLQQGRWRAIGEFTLKPGARLRIVPRESTVAGTLYADGVALEPLDR